MSNDTIVSTPIQSTASVYSENYKLTRALWYAYFRPEDVGRYRPALEVDDIPDVYKRAYGAMSAGDHKGLAQLMLDDDHDALDLIAYVVNLPHGTLIAPTRRQGMPALNTSPISGAGIPERGAISPEELAADLFTPAALEIELGAGTGQWPDAPPHTCDAKEACGTVLTIKAHRTHATRIYNPTFRTCEACLHERAQRIARQVLLEITVYGAMVWTVATAYDFKKWTAKARQYRRRKGVNVHYRALPQGDGRVFYMATAGSLAGVAVPTDRAELLDLITFYCNTPEGNNASASHGFGGDWQRMRGDGRTAAEERAEAKERGRRLMEYRAQKRAAGHGAIQRWTDSNLEDVAAAIGAQVKNGRDGFSVQIARDDLFTRCDAQGVKLRDKRHVTHLAQKKTIFENCTKCVTDAPPVPMALWDGATLDALEEVPTWDTYSV